MSFDSGPIQRRVPNRREAAVFRAKTLLLQAKKLIGQTVRRGPRRFSKSKINANAQLIAISRSKLWSETDGAERMLIAGKIQNLRIAVALIDGIEVPAGEIFSFWKHIGRTSRFRGFVEGRELREGCLIPGIGGGLCQLSNALYDAALQADFEIVERHAHTRVMEGSLAETGRDATVFWNYVDLRFRSALSFQIRARLDGENLTVQFRSNPDYDHVLVPADNSSSTIPDTLNNCFSCDADSCHRSRDRNGIQRGRTAYLVDEIWPEFDRYLQANKEVGDALFLPINGGRFHVPNYSWSIDGFKEVRQSLAVTVLRSYLSRKFAAQGAARQLNLLATYQKLARSYAERLRFEHLHIVVQQNLLPFLWRDGHLGGRTYDVLMTALPMHVIHESLDHAFSLHPESRTLADFRADEDLVFTEKEALSGARKIITPHTAIADLFPQKSTLIPWAIPRVPKRSKKPMSKPVIAFPASTVGRKGCYELREALHRMNVKIVVLGPSIESPNFWHGFDVQESFDWLTIADVVVLPAFVENNPRRLLRAVTAGIPVVATSECGLANVTGVDVVDSGNVNVLRAKLREVLFKPPVNYERGREDNRTSHRLNE